MAATNPSFQGTKAKVKALFVKITNLSGKSPEFSANHLFEASDAFLALEKYSRTMTQSTSTESLGCNPNLPRTSTCVDRQGSPFPIRPYSSHDPQPIARNPFSKGFTTRRHDSDSEFDTMLSHGFYRSSTLPHQDTLKISLTPAVATSKFNPFN